MNLRSDTIQAQFGNKIRQLREKRDVSQEELAHIAGLNRTYTSDLERGKRNPTLQNINNLANALNVSLKELFDL